MINSKIIGANAGIIWNLLSKGGKMKIGKLKRESGLSEKEILTAIGWLARENKIEFEDSDDEEECFYVMIQFYF
jgi:hypothetical protein